MPGEGRAKKTHPILYIELKYLTFRYNEMFDTISSIPTQRCLGFAFVDFVDFVGFVPSPRAVKQQTLSVSVVERETETGLQIFLVKRPEPVSDECSTAFLARRDVSKIFRHIFGAKEAFLDIPPRCWSEEVFLSIPPRFWCKKEGVCKCSAEILVQGGVHECSAAYLVQAGVFMCMKCIKNLLSIEYI